MSKIKRLENIKFLKELEFIESEFDYKNEVILEADTTFIKTINAYLDTHPELKKLFDESVNKKIDKMVKDKMNSEVSLREEEIDDQDDNSFDDENEINNEVNQSKPDENSEEESKLPSKIKKLYREIVKQTHPDKVKNRKLNDLYLIATKAYEQENLLKIYAVCNELDIEYEIDEEDSYNIINKISTLKERISFLESTFTWKWHHSDDPKEKESIILKYIASQLKN